MVDIWEGSLDVVPKYVVGLETAIDHLVLSTETLERFSILGLELL